MNLLKVFRKLILVQFALMFLTLIVVFVGDLSYPEEIAIMSERIDTFSMFNIPESVILITSVFLMAAVIFAYISLYRLKTYGRTLFVALMIFGYFITPVFFPYDLNTGWETAMDSLINTIDGALLCLIFLTPVKDYFQVNTTDKTAESEKYF